MLMFTEHHFVKHLRSEKHLRTEKENNVIVPEWLFKEPLENKIKKLNNPKTLKQLTIEKIKLDDKHLNKELAEKMIDPYYFTDRALRVGSNNALQCHHKNHAISKLKIKPNYPESVLKYVILKKSRKTYLLFMLD